MVASQPTSVNLPTASTADAVVEHLRNRVHSGDLRSGDQLPSERELSAMLGVGRQTLREGLKTLTAEGYLVARRGRGGGTFVTPLTEVRTRWLDRMRQDRAELDDILDFRIAVESRAAALAARRRTDTHLAAMRSAIDDLGDPGDRAAFRRLDVAFHRAVTDAAASDRLATAVHRSRGELFMDADRIAYVEVVDTTRSAHTAVLVGIADRDETAAAAAMTAHIEQTRSEFSALLEGRL